MQAGQSLVDLIGCHRNVTRLINLNVNRIDNIALAEIPASYQAQLGGRERHKDLVILVEEARAAFALQHADHLEGQAIQGHQLTDCILPVGEKFICHRAAQNNH